MSDPGNVTPAGIPVEPGRTILHYRLIRKIGEGGMGVVFQAEDTRLRRMVALKFLSRRVAESPEFRARFFREAQAAALDHPNVCTVYSLDETPHHLFLVMAYVEGQALNRIMEKRPVDPYWAVHLSLQIAEGLEHAHKRGVVHRDIKPANVLVTPGGVARITDFGVALLTERSRITAAGAILGTVAYMSPEQALGRDLDHRTDLWSLGVVLHEMLSGRHPFGTRNSSGVMRAIVQQEPAPLQLPRAVQEGLGRIVTRLLAKKPGDRFQHADDLVVDLRALLRKMPEPGGQPPWSEVTQDSARATPVSEAPTATFVARATASTRPRWMIPAIVTMAAVLLVAAVWFVSR